jgi:hypothetical protein
MGAPRLVMTHLWLGGSQRAAPQPTALFILCPHRDPRSAQNHFSSSGKSARECDASASSACELVHTAGVAYALIDTDMREHVLLFCLLGLMLIAAIILVIAPAAVIWALAIIE